MSVRTAKARVAPFTTLVLAFGCATAPQGPQGSPDVAPLGRWYQWSRGTT